MYSAETKLATSEVGEPAHAGSLASHSVWWRWNAPIDELVTVEAFAGFDTVLAIYRGSSFDDLTLVVANDNVSASLKYSQATFAASPGTTYYLVVDGANDAVGHVTLEFSSIPFEAGPPLFSGQPLGQTVGGWTRVTLEASVSGSLPLAFQWWHDDKLIKGATNLILTLPSVQVGDSGLYRMAASNVLGTVFSSNAFVHVTAQPEIISSPVSQRIAPTETARFSAKVIGNPTLGYQWYKDSLPLPLANSSTLEIPNVGPSDVGIYKLRVLNFFGGDESAEATLSLSRPPTTEDLMPRISGFNSVPTATEGASVTFGALVVGEKPISFQWALNGNPISGATNQVYRISRVSLGQSGEYSVSIANSRGVATGGAPGFEVLPLSVPANDNFTNRISVVENSEVGLVDSTHATKEVGEPVDPNGYGGKSVWWQWTAPKGGVAVVDTAGSDIYSMLAIYRGTAIDSLELVSRDWSYHGKGGTKLEFQVGQGEVFVFSVDDYFGEGGVVALRVNFTPDLEPARLPEISTFSSSTNVPAGSNVKLSTGAMGAHPLYYQWWKGGDSLPGYTNATLSITNAQAKDAGDYRLVVSNRVGTTWSDIANIGVMPARPSVASRSRDLAVTEDYPIRLAVNAYGTLPMSYQWSVNGVVVPAATNSSLVRSNSVPGYAGNYFVRISNAAGETNLGPVVVDVISAPIRYRWTTLAGSSHRAGRVDGKGETALFYWPSGIAVEASGNILVADAGSGSIRRVTPEGEVMTIATGFTSPTDVASYKNGAIIVQDVGQRATYQLLADGTRARLPGGTWGVGAGDDGAIFQVFDDDLSGSVTRVSPDGTSNDVIVRGLKGPEDVVTDRNGNLFIAEASGGTIRKVAPDGKASIVAGISGVFDEADGLGAKALFKHPNSVDIDSNGNLFVADEFGSTIRKIDFHGMVTTVGGDPVRGGVNDGVGHESRFSAPRRVAVAPSGELYVADTGNNSIRKGTPFLANTNRPLLHVSQRGGQVILSWDILNSDFILEMAGSLVHEDSWARIDSGIVIEGDRAVYSEEPGSSERFYRLRQP
ncbi:MAG TPA: immunoglobulin domain-containing protein [Candidatus Limnocylindria bacterium]|nr:immunoglobulin domain-containing protein [Candidatus Limnocylindria bacterium]